MPTPLITLKFSQLLPIWSVEAVHPGILTKELEDITMIGDISKTPVDVFKTNYKKDEKEAVRESTLRTHDRTDAKENKDSVTLNTKAEEPITYSKPLTDEQKLDAKFLMLRELVSKVFKEQGLSASIDIGEGKTVDLSELTPEAAEKLVADDGYWGVEQTSDRIVNLALGFAGNDPTKLDKVKEGVLKGLELAKKDFGMDLPDISQKTIDAVMKKLDDWAEEMKNGQATQEAGKEPPNSILQAK